MVQIPEDREHQEAPESLFRELERPAPLDRVWYDAGAALEQALGELSPEERVFLKMRVLHGCTVREIARAFHFDPPRFRRRFHSLLQTLARHIAGARHEDR